MEFAAKDEQGALICHMVEQDGSMSVLVGNDGVQECWKFFFANGRCVSLCKGAQVYSRSAEQDP